MIIAPKNQLMYGKRRTLAKVNDNGLLTQGVDGKGQVGVHRADREDKTLLLAGL